MFTDDEIVRSVQDGNTRNYEILINRYKAKIFNFVYSMVFDYDEAQGIAQDVFIKVFETLKKYRANGNFSAFIFTVAKNMTLNRIKKKRRTIHLSDFFSRSSEDEQFSYESTQEAYIETDEKERMLLKALKDLKENQRIALILKVYMDFPYQKIAEITGWSIPKTETLISRAKQNLKNSILMQENKLLDVKQVRTT